MMELAGRLFRAFSCYNLLFNPDPDHIILFWVVFDWKLTMLGPSVDTHRPFSHFCISHRTYFFVF